MKLVNTPSVPINRSAVTQIALRGLLVPIAILVVLLVSAGRVDYWQAWFYMLVNMILIMVNLWALRGAPDLIEERLKPGQGAKSWDQVYFAITTLLYFGCLITAGLDVGRFGWTPALPWWVYLVALIVYLIGQAIFLWAKRVNRFFSTVVRIQTERGQTVCREGPYRYIRHPGYAGGLLYMLSGVLLLGSWWALIPQIVACIFLVVRTTLEDKTLQQELPGYLEYTQQVKYRLLPGIW